MAVGGGCGVVAEHGGCGADEGGVDGGVEAVAAVEGVASGVARSDLAGGAAVEDVVKVGHRFRRADAAGGGEAQGEVGAVLGRGASEVLVALLAVACLEDGGRVGGGGGEVGGEEGAGDGDVE